MKRSQAFSNKLLKVLVVGGVVTIAAVNPFFGLLAAKVIEEELKKRKWKRFKDDLYYLKRRGLVKTYQNRDGSYRVTSTTEGRRQVAKYDLEDIRIKIPQKWDKYWWFVIFDIPTEKQKGRLALLSGLRRLGFIKFQKSVWVHPFKCRNEVATLAKISDVEEYVHWLVCRDTSAGNYLRNEFEKRNTIKLVS
ncbi:MAG: hypothetical protein A3J46_00865 [Candidatus Yanofskybacteria bacterium RIFCSPHIGHO2_02_FULL_41_11]|uniref:Transcriptional repressor PaaX-like central Cas2-like domain-containing protein n=1 Tax=Candidatus Yanofskybacteria bacterium RIFCSPHIGHO2_02_FULL_41_11 TaxID=1802675 RepID=A0A1F8F4V2_9BACT|nr:MAG: hypothetical protein A3J46_00865 [Candidatus Yanofskybacteria bacterium RIFCSPHIGHO2_02_FULL_41_11]